MWYITFKPHAATPFEMRCENAQYNSYATSKAYISSATIRYMQRPLYNIILYSLFEPSATIYCYMFVIRDLEIGTSCSYIHCRDEPILLFHPFFFLAILFTSSILFCSSVAIYKNNLKNYKFEKGSRD